MTRASALSDVQTRAETIIAKRQPTRASSSPFRKFVAENITGRR